MRGPVSGPVTGESIAVWGDGAVGIGLSVALSASCSVILIGPAGSPDCESVFDSSGSMAGSAVVRHMPADRAVPADLCIMAVKACRLAEASSQSRAVGNTLHACLCNGMGLEDAWGPGWEDVEKAVVLGGFERVGPESVRVHPGGLVVGEGGVLQALFSCTPLEVSGRPAEELEATRWAKWLVNSSLNPVAALTSSRNVELVPRGLEPLLRTILEEITPAVPEALRRQARQTAELMLAFLLENSSNRCSMLQDVEAGRPTEIEFMTGLASRLLPGGCPVASAVASLVRARASRTCC